MSSSEPTPASGSGTNATGGGGQQRSGRGRGRSRTQRSGGTRAGGRGGQTRTNRAMFKGNTDEMHGNVFECYEEQNDRRQYSKTFEVLESYAKKTLRYSEDLAPLFSEDMREPTIDMPTEPGDEPSKTADMIYSEEVKEYVKRVRTLKSNLAALHAVIWGQCSEAMRAKVKSLAHYKARTAENDCYWLLKQIKAVTLQFDEKRNGFISLLDARTSFLTCKQLQGQSADDYLETLRGWADTIEYHGGTVAENHELVPEKDDEGNMRTIDERKAIARDRTLAIALIRGADPTRYGTLTADLSNQYASGKDEYPIDISAAYSLLVNYRTPTNARIRGSGGGTPAHQSGATPEASAMTFAQRGSVAGSNGITHDGITCYNCQETGHYASDCPTEANGGTATGTTLVQHAFMLTQADATGIDPEWILLDSQSTISVFRNPRMLTNIRRSDRVLRALTNGGHQDSHMVGDFPNLGEVWYNPQSIANILSLAEVRKVCRITMDSSSDPAMHVHRLDGSVMSFTEHPSGLYVYSPNDSSNTTVTAYTMVSTVAQQKKMFSRREVQAADHARDLYRKIGRPSEAEFQRILKQNLIRNCPVTPDDAKRALIIYGPDIAALKGKTTHSQAAPHAPTFIAVPIPAPILDHHSNVTLCADFFFVQGSPYYHTISRGIGFRTIGPVPDRTKTTILREARAAIHLYQARGLTVRDVHADHEFECIREDIRPIALNVVPTDSHVGEVERSIRTIKERLRACVHGLPFKRLPRLLITHMLADVVRCLNQFPRINGVSDAMSPACIIAGTPLPDYAHMRLEFGSYVQVFEDNSPSNTPRARSLGAIALNPTGNAQGDYFFMSLATGAKISRHQWTELPMTDTAIARVEAIALNEGQPLIQDKGLVVEWRPDQPIDDAEYDRDYAPPEHAPLDFLFDAHDDFDPIDDDELADLHADVDPDLLDAPFAPPGAPHQGAIIEEDEADEATEEEEAIDDGVYDDDDDEEEDYDEDEEADDDNPNDNNDDDQPPDAPGADAADAIEMAEMAEHQGAIPRQNQGANLTATATGPYNLRARGVRPNRFADAMDTPHSHKSYYPPATQLLQQGQGHADDTFRRIFGYIMTQMSMKQGIKKHGKAAEAAMMLEFGQLEDLSVYVPLRADSLTAEQKRDALLAFHTLKEKRDGKLKSRTVADGRKQKSLYDKSETASPTVATDALILTIIVDAYENRDVGTADVAGAYLKADMDDFVIMKFTGESVDILCLMNPEYEQFVTMEKGVRVLYVRLDKAMYGCVKSALLWYELLSNTLKEMGFVLNPYDPCVANCMIDGKQCTIAWYVDDMKISHVDPEVVSTIIAKIEERFGKMTVTRGREHVFLGMKIRYTEERTAIVTMKDYLQEAIDESDMNITREATTPARRTLFDVNDKAKRLRKSESETFHSVVAKLLYVAIRARMDILLTVGFLCTRVSKSTAQDQVKLKRLLEYIKGSIDLEYTLGADDMGKIRTWVDASYAVHPDMKSHTGGVISFGRGGIICKSSKQKLNTKSSTEAELVGASDYLPNTIWVKMFLEAQGHEVKENVLEQDNESAIKLEKNGRMSAGPKSRHIDIRYFWIKDRAGKEKITIRHCPTLQMLGDFFTKPLQGTLYRKFRDVILGYAHVDTLTMVDPSTSAEEGVERKRSEEHGSPTVGFDDSRGLIPVTRKRNESANEMTQLDPRGKLDKGRSTGTTTATETGLTWADVVRRTSVPTTLANITKGVSRSLSRNNPVI